MEKTLGSLRHCLWLALAASTPLFCLPYARLNAGIYHVPVPAFLVSLILLVHLPSPPGGRPKNPFPYRILFLLSFVVLITHGIGTLRGDPVDYAVREFIKIASGILCFWVIILYLPNRPGFLKLFLQWSAATSLGLLTFLIYRYAVVFKAPYLGTIFTVETWDGRNHLAWFLAALLPYFLASLFEKRVSLFWILVNSIVCLSILYSTSRSTWMAVILMTGYLAFFAFKDRLRPNLRMAVLLAAGIAVSVGFLVHADHLGEAFETRFQTIYNPDSLPETHETYRLGKYSRGMRWGLIRAGINQFQKNPWLGQGLARAYHNPPASEDEKLTHNDYLGLLADTGLMGGVPFFAFLILLAVELLRPAKDGVKAFLPRAAQASFLTILFLSNFINIYTSLHYWLFLGLALKVRKIGLTEDAPQRDGLL